MTSVMALDASPLQILRSLRGVIVEARIGYPRVLHVEISDADDGTWLLATQDADWFPSDPMVLAGRSVEGAEISGSGELRLSLSDGSLLEVKSRARETEDDPPNWEVITPEGLVLEFGPGVRWQIHSADSS